MNSSPDLNGLKSCSLWACLVLAACGVDSGAALDDATTAEDAAALSASAVQVKGAATVGANQLEYFCPKTSRACRPRYVALSFNAPGGQPLRVEVTPQSAGGDAELWVTNSSYRTLGSSAPADSASAIVELVVPLLHTRPTTQLYLVVRDAKLERSTFTVRVCPPVKQRQVTQVSVGAFHSCARFDDGSVQCWGSNHTGALGDGTTTEHPSAGGPFAYKPVTAVIDGVSDISAGLNATCAVRNGQALCWGSAQAGYLGRDAPATVLQPTAVPVTVRGQTLPLKTVQVGWQRLCFVTTSGSGGCDGRDPDGWGLTGQRFDTNLEAFSVGGYTDCAKLTNDEVTCWGSNGSRQLGVSPSVMPRTSNPTRIGSGQLFSAGNEFLCRADTTGSVSCQGSNFADSLGTASGSLVLPRPITSMSSGNRHTCAVADGRVFCWGNNQEGQLGIGSTVRIEGSVEVVGVHGRIRAVSARASTTCALSEDGVVWCWGGLTASGAGGFATFSTVPLEVPLR